MTTYTLIIHIHNEGETGGFTFQVENEEQAVTLSRQQLEDFLEDDPRFNDANSLNDLEAILIDHADYGEITFKPTEGEWE